RYPLSRFLLLQDHYFFAGLLQNVLILRAKSGPSLRANCKYERINGVVPERDVTVHGPEFVRNDECDRILLSVHHMLLEGRLGLVPVHRDGFCAQRVKNLYNYWYRRHAYS